MKVIYTAAHAGASLNVPIGGGGAIARMLEQEWMRTRPFTLEIERPVVSAHEIVRYSQAEYTRFCYRFKRQTTNRVLSENPAGCVVLSNDISEGPDFELLARHGYRVFTIWHIDVLAFVTRMYLKGLVRPEMASRLMRPFEKWLPGPLGLVFKNQHDCVRNCAGHFVMTEAMKQTILACYPETPAEKIHVVPWGASPIEGIGVRRPSDVPVILMLSRIAPEKGQHRVLNALREVSARVKVVIAGEASFMDGESYLRKLRSLADNRVEFVGHLTGQAKLDAFASADLYVFPSVSESYGLTLMEALSHGLPVVAWDHDGARAIVEPAFGILVNSEPTLRQAILDLLADPERRRRMGEAARAYATARPFSKAADQVARTLLLR